MERTLSFEPEELQRALDTGNVHHGLSNENIQKAAHIIFGDQDKITQDFYQNTIVAGNYIGFDLERHGFPNLLGDMKLLTNTYRTALHTVRQTTKNHSNKVFFMGCGPGRLAIPEIEISKKLGVREIVFNDLLADHVDATREKVAKCYGTRNQKIDGIKIEYLSGDFLQIADTIRKRFDAMFAMWFVTSEICDFESVEALREKRKLLFSQIKKLLTKQGIFVEDIPFSEGVGSYYYLARLKTYAVLHEMGIMEGENDHMLLTDFTDIQKGGFPYHIRYVPSNGKHRRELEQAGFKEQVTTITTIPNAVKNPTQYEAEFGLPDKIKTLFEGNTIDDLLRYLTQKEYEFLATPNLTEPLAQQKKTILWRQAYMV